MGLIRKLLPYTTVLTCIALLYVGWIFYSRRNENAELQRTADAKSMELAKRTYEMYGSGQVKVLSFYAVPGVVRRGQTTQLCYGVSNAAKVRIDSGVEPVAPALSRCLAVKVRQTTNFTITAEDDRGHHVEQSVEVVAR